MSEKIRTNKPVCYDYPMRKTALTALVLLAPAPAAPSAQAKLPEASPTGGAAYEEGGAPAPAPEASPTGGASYEEGGAAPVPAPAPDLQLIDGQVINRGGPLPRRIQRVIAAANRIAHKPYLWGGGHGRFRSPGYDCSGSVSYALHGGKFLNQPRDSTGLARLGKSGKGKWFTVYANAGHAYIVIGKLRFDTAGGNGPRWHKTSRSSRGFTARYVPSY